MLALLEYFWTEADWVPAPSVSVAEVVVIRGAGSGAGYDIQWPVDPAFSPSPTLEPDRLPSDYWEVRERYIRRLLRPTSQPQPSPTTPEPVSRETIPLSIPPSPPPDISLLYAERAAAISAARAARTRTDLLRIGALIAALTLQLQRYEDEALELLLLAAASTII